MLRHVCFVLAILVAHSSAMACSDLNGDGVVNVADFLIFVDDFGKTVTCDHAQKVQLVIQNQFNDAVWDTSRNADGVLTITITQKPPPPVTTPPQPPSDRDILVELYNATGGENWEYKENWLSNMPLNEWQGVYTTEEGRVDSLTLNDNNLSGSIPASLGNLSNLQVLYLDNNGLSGSIPASLGNLSNLKALSIGNNALSGSIPASLGNLSDLQVLWLEANELSGSIPESLGNLINLTYLFLNQNKLSGPLPESFVNIKDLRHASVYNKDLCLPSSPSLNLWARRHLEIVPPPCN